MEQVRIGEELECGWNEAKQLGDDGMAYTTVRLEAIGHDWAVLRGDGGQSLAVAFDSRQQLENFFDNMRA